MAPSSQTVSDAAPEHPISIVVLAAGMGTRMKSSLPKVLHPVAGRPMVRAVLDAAAPLDPQKSVVVIGPDMPMLEQAVAPVPTAQQTERLGTAHAVLQAKDALDGVEGTVLVLYGDTPLIPTETLRKLVACRADAVVDPAVVVLGFYPQDPGPYGRLITDEHGALEAIVEAKDATSAQAAVRLCNSGVMAVDAAVLFPLLAQVDNNNAKGEYYLTDLVALARAAGRRCAVVEGDETDLMGVNSRVELAQAEAVTQQQLREAAMVGGVTLTAPDTVFFSHDTALGKDITIGPFTTFGPGVRIADGVTIKGFCHFEQCTIGEGAIVGPYARLRPGAEIGESAHIGNFVEIKKAVVAEGAKVNHLAYVGDAVVGEKANVGAGTICCNYDGFDKHKTEIGPGAFIGSNSALVAPVSIGAGAIVGAGSTIAQDVPEDGLAVARGRQEMRPGWAAKFRAMRQRLRG